MSHIDMCVFVCVSDNNNVDEKRRGKSLEQKYETNSIVFARFKMGSGVDNVCTVAYYTRV